MSLSLSPFVNGRRGPFTGRGLGARAVVPLSPVGGIGGLPPPFIGRGFDPLARLGVGAHLGGACAGPLGIRGLNPLIARRDIAGGGHGLFSDAILRGGRYPDLGRRGVEDLPFSSRFGYGPYRELESPYRDLEALLGLARFDPGRGYCDGRGCCGGLGCGYDRRREHERCGCHRCSGSSSGSSSKDVTTKDMVVRGKTYRVRKSFLADATKFEADIVKLLDKKSEESMPNNVIQMLVDFINDESCKASSLLDVASLGILASSLGVKSAVEHALYLLKKHETDYDIRAVELTQICLAIMESSRVDDKLVEWLKKYLNHGGRARKLADSMYYQQILFRKPELGRHLEQLLGIVEKDDSEGEYRIL